MISVASNFYAETVASLGTKLIFSYIEHYRYVGVMFIPVHEIVQQTGRKNVRNILFFILFELIGFIFVSGKLC